MNAIKTYGIFQNWNGMEEKVVVWFGYDGNKMWITYTDDEGDIQTETVKKGEKGYHSNCFSLPEIEDILKMKGNNK